MSAQADTQGSQPLLDLVHPAQEDPGMVTVIPTQPVIPTFVEVSGYPVESSVDEVLVHVLTLGASSREATTRPLSCPLDVVELSVDERILVTGQSPATVMETVDFCLMCGLSVAVNAESFPFAQRALGQHVGAFEVIFLDASAPSRFKQWAFRARDIICSFLVLTLLLPLFIVIAFLIISTSRGPVFYCTEVVGRDERLFRWRKFRSMRIMNAQENHTWRRAKYMAFMTEGSGSIHGSESKKVVDLQRVTKIGSILRRHSIDELPQLLNVLRGNMTLVGPRPALPYEHELFADWQRLRVAGITPGLTGPWQAYGRSRATFDEMVLMDYCYGHSRSFLLDIRLMVRTLWVMVTGEGGI